MVQRIQVESIEHLVKLLKDGNNDYFIALSGGHARSSKYIQYNEDDCKPFYVNNEIDDTEDMFSVEELKSSHIGEAISKKSFYCEIYGVEDEPKDIEKDTDTDGKSPSGYKATVRIADPSTFRDAIVCAQFIKGDNTPSTLKYRTEIYSSYMLTLHDMAEQLIRDGLEAFKAAFSRDMVMFDPDVEPEPDAGFFDENGYASCFVEKIWIDDGKIMLGLYVIDDNSPVACEMEYKEVCDVDVKAIMSGILRQIESGIADDKVVCADSQKLD